MAEVDTVALDKTGTLTTGELRVESVESFPPGREMEIGRLAYSLERYSSHPLARAITRFGRQQSYEPVDFDQNESISGLGVRGRHNGQTSWLGRREWVINESRASPGMVAPVPEGSSEVWVAQEGMFGRLILRDDIRKQARDVVVAMGREGLQTVVLTGDHRGAAEHLKAQLQLADVRCELTPAGKVDVINALSRDGRRLAMVGDGVNDAPSLAAAHVGVAMGARGADAALEQAEVVLMHDRLENFLGAFRLSRRGRRIIRQNLVISLGTVVALMVFALAGSIPLTVGVIGHEGSTVLVVMNSLRLLFSADEQS